MLVFPENTKMEHVLDLSSSVSKIRKLFIKTFSMLFWRRSIFLDFWLLGSCRLLFSFSKN